MRLAWAEFENRFRKLHRQELKADLKLKKSFKNSRKASNTASANFARRMVMMLGISLGFSSFATKIKGPEFGLAILGLWAAGLAFRKAYVWFQTIYGSEDLMALSLLPISDEQIFRVQTRKYLLEFGWMLMEFFLLFFIFGVMLLVQKNQGSAVLIAAPVLALIQTTLICALAFHLAVFLHFAPLGGIGALLCSVAVIVLLSAPLLTGITSYFVQFASWFFPTGWVNYAFYQAAWKKDWVTLALMIPIGALVYGAFYSWRRMRAFYSLEGFEFFHGPGGHFEAEGLRRGATEIQDNIGERQFLKEPNWAGGGWVERFISKNLRGREKIVLEFLVSDAPGWTQNLKNSFWIWLASAMIIWLFGQYGGFIAFFPAYLLAAASLPLLGGDWRGLRQFPTGGVVLPAYAVYPVTFNEITRLMFKVNVVRSLAATPFLVSIGVLAAWKLNHSLAMGAQVSFKILGIFLAWQPMLVLFPISKSTNDTSKMKLLMFFVFIPLLLVQIGLAMAVFFLSGPVENLILFGAMTASATIIFLIYRTAYHRSKFDLLAARIS